MGSLASVSLDLIRTVFRRNLFYARETNPYEFQHLTNSYQWGVGPTASQENDMFKDLVMGHDLVSRYMDYYEMENYPEISSAIEILCDDATKMDTLTNKTIWVTSKNEEIERILNHTLEKSLEVEENIWDRAYNTALLGNDFCELIVQDKVGVIGMVQHAAPQVRKIMDQSGMLYGYIQDRNSAFKNISTEDFLKRIHSPEVDKPTDGIRVFEPWEMIHFKLNTGASDNIYGKSHADAARYPWKRLTLIEDSVVMNKLTRSQQRYVFYVDVGDVPPNEAQKILTQVKENFKKRKTVDEGGRIVMRANPLSQQEDFFIAKRKGERSTEVDILAGLDGQSVDDANYFKDKLISALKIPKSYLGYDETVSRANLGQMDVRWARTAMRLQRAIKNGYRHACQVDLSAKNIDPDRVDFTLNMSIPSGALEIAEVEVLKAKAELGQSYQGLNLSEHFIWSKILGMSDDEILKIKKQREIEGGNSNADSTAQEKVDNMVTASKYDNAELTGRILENVEKGVGDFNRRIRELRGLTGEINKALATRRK